MHTSTHPGGSVSLENLDQYGKSSWEDEDTLKEGLDGQAKELGLYLGGTREVSESQMSLQSSNFPLAFIKTANSDGEHELILSF